jgi:hypothetical protein
MLTHRTLQSLGNTSSISKLCSLLKRFKAMPTSQSFQSHAGISNFQSVANGSTFKALLTPATFQGKDSISSIS